MRRAAAVEKAKILTYRIDPCGAAEMLDAAENATHERDRIRVLKPALDLALLDHSATVRRLEKKGQRFLLDISRAN